MHTAIGRSEQILLSVSLKSVDLFLVLSLFFADQKQ